MMSMNIVLNSFQSLFLDPILKVRCGRRMKQYLKTKCQWNGTKYPEYTLLILFRVSAICEPWMYITTVLRKYFNIKWKICPQWCEIVDYLEVWAQLLRQSDWHKTKRRLVVEELKQIWRVRSIKIKSVFPSTYSWCITELAQHSWSTSIPCDLFSENIVIVSLVLFPNHPVHQLSGKYLKSRTDVMTALSSQQKFVTWFVINL